MPKPSKLLPSKVVACIAGVPKDRNFIARIDTMRESFTKTKEVLCDKCALYIANDRSE